MPVPKTDALPLGYTPYGLSLDGRTNGKGEAGLEERASRPELRLPDPGHNLPRDGEPRLF